MKQDGKRRAVRLALVTAASLAISAIGSSSFGQARKVITSEEWTEMRCPVRDPDRVFQRTVWSWKDIRDRNVVKQDRDYSCGAASLCTLLRYYWGDNVKEQKVLDTLDGMLKPDERKDRIKNGLSMTDLRRVS